MTTKVLKCWRVTLVFATLLVASCGDSFPIDFAAIGEKYPDVTIPVSLAKKGVVYTVDLDAGVKTYTYTVYLDFLIKKNDEQELQRVANLLGMNEQKDGGYIPDVNGQLVFIRTGIAIPLRLTVKRIDSGGETLVYDQSFQQLWAYGGNKSTISRAIADVRLGPAHYKVSLEPLADINELANVPINFKVGVPGKH